jgi:hypothetical protein
MFGRIFWRILNRSIVLDPQIVISHRPADRRGRKDSFGLHAPIENENEDDWGLGKPPFQPLKIRDGSGN